MAQDSWMGQMLGGRYKIEDVLGRGGMSAVYKATDPNLKRVVAVKMIHPHLSHNPEFVVRFKEEAAAVAQLRHPNIVQVFDFDNDGDTYYMVLEFVAGETLQERLKRLNAADRHLSFTDAMQFAMQICDAAEYAHQRGMVHRDIKPANVMLDVYGKAILTDFGIAKIIGGQFHTATGATVGTALYMSPEQIRGERVDERSDVYSIGVTLFEMVNGRPPYEADSAMTLLMMHLNDPVPDLHQLRPDTPDELVAVIEKALAKDRDQRFQSAAELATALQKVVDRLEKGPTDETEGPKAVEEPLATTWVEEPAATLPDETPARQPQLAAGRLAEAEARIPVATASPAGASEGPRTSAATPGIRPPVRQSKPAAPSVPTPLSRLRLSPTLIAGGVAGLTALLILAFLMGTLLSGNGDGSTDRTQETSEAAVSLDQQGTDTAAAQAQGATGTGIALAALATPALEESTEVPAVTTPSATATRTLTAQPTDTSAPTATAEPSVTLYAPSTNSTPTPQPTNTPPPTATREPSATPYVSTDTPVPLPTNTQPPGPYARINQITVQGYDYVVDYQTIGFVETREQWHTHFFFNTVPPEQAGVPGAGPWILYYGPSPFTQYKVSDRPASATQMCVRVANADHSLYYTPSGDINTGNCVNLP